MAVPDKDVNNAAAEKPAVARFGTLIPRLLRQMA
jgi:hypothetical protein